MINRVASLLALATVASFPLLASAAVVDLAFSGGGVSAKIELVYGSSTDSKVGQGFEVTGVSGTFSDANAGILDAPILGLLAIDPATPEPTNLLAPHDFSRFAVANGLSAQSHGFLTYDNLYYPGGSPATASDYPGAGGSFDIYGLMFRIGNGRVVDLWSNGIFGPPQSAPIEYGVAVATADSALDYVPAGISAVPEPSDASLLGSGLALLGLAYRRRIKRSNRMLVA